MLRRVRNALLPLLEAGIRNLAIAFVHSYIFPDHEAMVGDIARDMGFEHVRLGYHGDSGGFFSVSLVGFPSPPFFNFLPLLFVVLLYQVSLSSEAMPMIRLVPRAFTACADAYLTPCIREYASRLNLHICACKATCRPFEER